jgi:hypothetical protein
MQGGDSYLLSLEAFNNAAIIIKYKDHDPYDLLLEEANDQLNIDKIQAQFLEPYNLSKYEDRIDSLRNESPAATTAFTSTATVESSSFLLYKPKLTT